MRLLKVSLLVICALALATSSFAQSKPLVSTADQAASAGLPIFGANASLAEWGHAWVSSIAVPFTVSQTGWKVDKIGIVAFGPSQMDAGSTAQSVIVRIYGDDPNADRPNTSDIIAESQVDNITSIKKYLVSLNVELAAGKYWLALLPAFDDTRVSWVKSASAVGQFSNVTTERITTPDGKTSFVIAQAQSCPADALMASVPVFEIGGTVNRASSSKDRMQQR